MSLNIDGTNITEITYNGVDLSQLIFNGTVVWEKVYTVDDSNRVWFACTDVENSSSSSGHTHTLYRSENDGKTWTSVLTSDYFISVLAYNGSVLVASCYNYIYYSSDKGKTWNTVVSGNNLLIIYGKDKFIAGFRDWFSGKVYYRYSTNGSTWSSVQSITTWNGNIYFDDILYANGIYVGIIKSVSSGTIHILYSSTGTSWTDAGITSTSCGAVVKDGKFIIFQSNQASALTSTDGKDWNTVQVTCSNGNWMRKHPYKMGDMYYVYSVSNNSVTVQKSLDLFNWEQIDVDSKIIKIVAVNENSSYVLGIDSNNTVYRTTNFVNWVEHADYTKVPNSSNGIDGIERIVPSIPV